VPIATAVVGDANQAAVVAPLNMAAERRCAARLDGRHHTALVGQEPRTLRGTKRGAVAAEDVRHLKHGAHVRGSVGRDHRDGEPIEWAGRAGEQIGRNLSVARGRSEVGMSEQHLNDANVDPAFKKMSRK
jgi:hypothetical protein